MVIATAQNELHQMCCRLKVDEWRDKRHDRVEARNASLLAKEPAASTQWLQRHPEAGSSAPPAEAAATTLCHPPSGLQRFKRQIPGKPREPRTPFLSQCRYETEEFIFDFCDYGVFRILDF